jgi:hypothetical protein
MSDDLVRGVVIPLAQALATGILITLASIGLCLWQGQPWWIALMAGSLAALFSWWYLMHRWQRLIERILNPDCQDPQPFQPDEPETIRLQISQQNQDGYLEGQFIKLPVDAARLQQLANGLEAGKGLTVGTWTGSHGLFSRHEFEALRGELQIRGLVRPASDRSPQRGYELTLAGRHVFKRLSSPPAE